MSLKLEKNNIIDNLNCKTMRTEQNITKTRSKNWRYCKKLMPKS